VTRIGVLLLLTTALIVVAEGTEIYDCVPLPSSDCAETYPARPSGVLLDAAFSRDDVEADPGIFMQSNQTSVDEMNFGYLKYRMRPFTLDAADSITSGTIELDIEGGILEAFQMGGERLELPRQFDRAELPFTFLVNATACGVDRIVATTEADDAGDEVRVRVGHASDLAGQVLPGHPFFRFAAAINSDQLVHTAIDPVRHAERVGLTYQIYLVDHKTPEMWEQDPTLEDVSGRTEAMTVQGASIADNIASVWDPRWVAAKPSESPFDVVFDFGADGTLDPGDLIDGLSPVEAGFYLMGDLSARGSHETEMLGYWGGWGRAQVTYWPADIATMGQVPLVMISHGNGHEHTWYDWLGHHLASHGYVVCSHQTTAGGGPETASLSTLVNTEFIIAHQDTIAGGVLNGHIDAHRITWIGHSRGGEGVVRAYDRLLEHDYVPPNYVAEDVVLISSIAPTVILPTTDSDPHDRNYHLIAGSADGDVNGGAEHSSLQSLRITQAARGNVQVTYIHGAAHNDFNCCGANDADGPEILGREEVQRIAKSYFLALIRVYIEGSIPARDFFTRPYEDYHPQGIGEHVTIANQFKPAEGGPHFVIDDYQTAEDPAVSSSGGAVVSTMAELHEGALNDANYTFTWTPEDPMNGMTQQGSSDAYRGGVVFEWTLGEHRFYELEIIPDERDLTDDAYLSFRACQGSRHPETVRAWQDADDPVEIVHGTPLSFVVTLRDGQGTTSSIDFGSYGRLTSPYLRTGLGPGAGWANEFCTLRLPLEAFERDGTGIDLSCIEAVRFDFGEGFGAPRGRVGMDDVMLIGRAESSEPAARAASPVSLTHDYGDAPAVIPTDQGASVRDLIYARSFTLEEPFTYLWMREHPQVTSGTILVLDVDRAYARPRPVDMPVLYVGGTPAELMNVGYESGTIIAIVPGNRDLTAEPIFFGSIELPERVDASRGQEELAAAWAAGIRPFSSETVRRANARGGRLLAARTPKELLLAIADLLDSYAPDESDRTRAYRAPEVRR